MKSGTIDRIFVEELFGQFTYRIPRHGNLANPAILYGDNGVGKSTILKLVFHLLSAAGDKGHRTALHDIPFKSLSVQLNNGSLLQAVRPDSVNDTLIVFTITNKNQEIAVWFHDIDERKMLSYDFDEDDVDDYIRNPNVYENLPGHMLRSLKNRAERTKSEKVKSEKVKYGEQEYLDALQQSSPTIFLVSADRRLDSDTIVKPNADLEFKQMLHLRGGSNNNNEVSASRGIALKQALITASRWVVQRAVHSANQGSMNVHSVYEQVLTQLSMDYGPTNSDESSIDLSEMVDTLRKIESDTGKLSEYELTTKLNMRAFVNSLIEGQDEGKQISAKLIETYIRTVKSRLEAIDSIYQILDNFVRTINSFLNHKRIAFILSDGFSIINHNGDTLDANHLSSGEQQLLLMFCYALTAGDRPSVFMIDEPEISLNIKWQRRLLNCLVDITQDSDIQFIFASHSLELIAQHRSSVVELEF